MNPCFCSALGGTACPLCDPKTPRLTHAELVAKEREETGWTPPENYVQCHACGYDHDYELLAAQEWHAANDEGDM